ncbi:MAG: thiamine pyrophosphate-dependent enzyme, partial [Trebonia sp.]
FAHPDRPVLALVGDGAMQMNGNAELLTIARYWKRWKDPRLIVLVLHNNDLNQVTWEMRAMAGAPKFAESQNLPDIDFAAFAASLGLNAMAIKDPEELGDAWRNALSADRPTVLDVYTDPDMPPIPPHATWEQFKSATAAVLGGDEDRVGFVKVGLKTKMQEFMPHKKS